MGCQLPSLCPIQDPSSCQKENIEENPLTTRKNNTSRSNLQDQPTADSRRQRPLIKRLNFQSLIFPPISSERSSLSYHNSEVKDKVAALISSRQGKSFLVLLKQINFSVKIIQQLDKKKSELNSSVTSLTSKESILSVNSFKIAQQCKTSDNCLSEECSNLLKFKNLFYLPLISINGDIETNFEIGKGNPGFSFFSFGVMFDYYESFFSFLINLFQNFNYSGYKESLVLIASFASEIQKIKLGYYPESNSTSLSLHYMSEEFYSLSLGKGTMKELNSKRIQKDCLSFIYNCQRTQPIYEVAYKNISLQSEECYAILAKYATSPSMKEAYHRFMKDYTTAPHHQKRIVLFSISYFTSKDSELECIGFKVKQVINEKTTGHPPTPTELSENSTTVLKINSKIAEVKYQTLTVSTSSITVSYDYYYI